MCFQVQLVPLHHGLKMVDFLQNVVPVRARHDKQLVSHDSNNNSYNYQYTFMIEIVPICKEDIVCLPHKVSIGMGGIGWGLLQLLNSVCVNRSVCKPFWV